MSDSHYNSNARRPTRAYTQLADSTTSGEWGDVSYDFPSSYPPPQSRLDHHYMPHPRTVMQQQQQQQSDFMLPMLSSQPSMHASHSQHLHTQQPLDMPWGRSDSLDSFYFPHSMSSDARMTPDQRLPAEPLVPPMPRLSSDIRMSSDLRMSADPRMSVDLRMPTDVGMPSEARIPRISSSSRMHSHSPVMQPRYREASWDQRYLPGVGGESAAWLGSGGTSRSMESGPLRSGFDTRVIMNAGTSRSAMDGGPSRGADDLTIKRDSPESTGLDLLDTSSPATSERSLPSAAPKNQQTEKQCSHCGVKQTPLWRRDPSNFQLLCNACGLFYKQRHMHRPKVLIEADQEDDAGDDDPDAPTCSHCGTHRTSVWRRGKDGTQVCNACGVYSRLRGKERPLALKKNKIRPRTKYPKAPPSS